MYAGGLLWLHMYLRKNELLFDDDVVAALQQNILLHLLALDHVEVVELVGLIAAKNQDVLLIGKLCETACFTKGLENFSGSDQRIFARPVHAAINVVLLAADLFHNDGHIGVVHILRELL